MAYQPKKKRLEKTIQEEPPVISNHNFYCCRCGLAFSRQKGFFPVSHSPMYRGSGYLPMCNDCVEYIFEDYIKKLGSSKDAMKRICMKMDLYWDDKLYDTVEKTAGTKSRVRSYISKTNIIKYIDKTYDDTIAEEEKMQQIAQPVQEQVIEDQTNVDVPNTEEVVEEIVVPDEVMAFWGPGYTTKMYLDLQDRWDYYVSKFLGEQNIDIGTEVLIKQICNLEIDINRDRAAGKPVDKYVGQINTILGSLSLKPVQKKEEISDNGLDTTPFGVWIERWENEQPVPEPDPELEDADGVIRYIHVWFFGHLSKLLGLKNIYSKMYEDEIARYRVEKPEYEDLDDEEIFDDVFGAGIDDDGDEP